MRYSHLAVGALRRLGPIVLMFPYSTLKLGSLDFIGLAIISPVAILGYVASRPAICVRATNQEQVSGKVSRTAARVAGWSIILPKPRIFSTCDRLGLCAGIWLWGAQIKCPTT
ncbi:uncharacterized protein BCR38DRAFT_425759 [Pseudomassariella vexata]|uniref:Uncharacterized protein n=1 Tax=Pseudomassariella vexata TaxID=1141098 RepID=A0A1Y2E669_9PEZI|nr:uncharacterized protein BCR38DRAFT_425759 [Pseudomassariella vexata]ORY67041.1 hypothetical protein BCR38DRAFT_425759 [Pseudomassariella vexata]